MIAHSFLRIPRVIWVSLIVIGLIVANTVQPVAATTPTTPLDSADYTFVYPDASGNNSLPDPAAWSMQTSSWGSEVVQAPVPYLGLCMSDPDDGASLMYVHNAPFLSGDPYNPNFQNTATFRVRSRVSYVLDGSGVWSGDAIGWRMMLDDGGARLELALARTPGTFIRKVRIQNAAGMPSIDFPWDNDMDNTYEITRLSNGDFLITITNADTSSPNPIATMTIPRVSLHSSTGVPQFAWGSGREGGGAACWVEAHAEVHSTVANQAPVIGPITAPLAPVPANTTISTSASFTNPDASDTHNATWDWGDGSTSDGVVSEANGVGTVNGSHTYSNAGVYPVTLTVTDSHGASAQATFNYVVVYDPSAGFVTGGGWINSPTGAYALDPTLSGKASFGFVSKYQKGANVPTGHTEFQFKAGNLNFRSTAYDWLVVAGPKAQFKGSGRTNDNGDYGFLLTAVDGEVNGGGGVDKFRIKIWDKATGNVVYDNQVGASDGATPTTAINGGSIVIKK